ncbi:unnamed protein product, partial [Urochloa humidicola]
SWFLSPVDRIIAIHAKLRVGLVYLGLQVCNLGHYLKYQSIETMNSVIFPLDLRPSRPRLSQCSMKIDDDSHLVYGSPSTHILKNPTLKKKQIS